MLLGYLPPKKKNGKAVPLFLPANKPLLVGEGIFALLQGQNDIGALQAHPLGLYTLTTISSSDDLSAKLEPLFHSKADFHLIRLEPYFLEAAKEVLNYSKGKPVYILCPELDTTDFLGSTREEIPFAQDKDVWDAFSCDLVGLPRPSETKPKKKEEPSYPPVTLLGAKDEPAITPIRVEETPLPEESYEEGSSALWTLKGLNKKHLIKRLKNDGLNTLFAVIFLGLYFATTLGYFFLGGDSGDAFRIACIVMAALFPFMASIPVGFIYHDAKIRFPHESVFVMAAFSLIGLVSFFLPIVSLGLGNANSWNQDEQTLFALLGLSAFVWMPLRILFDKQVTALFSKKKKKA